MEYPSLDYHISAYRRRTLALLISSLGLIASSCPHNLVFKEIRTIAVAGNGPGQVNGPAGVVERNIGDTLGPVIFVADQLNNRIAIWSDTGLTFLRNISSLNGSDTALSGPRDISATHQADFYDSLISVDSLRLYIADTENHRVVVCDIFGNLIASWGGVGVDSGKFERLTGIDVDRWGNVYTVDSSANLVQMFDSLGSFIRSWGSPGSSAGEFNGSHDISVRHLGEKLGLEILVADYGNNRVQSFDTLGNIVEIFSEIPQPLSIDAVDGEDNGDAFVVSGIRRLLILISGPRTEHSDRRLEGLDSPFGSTIREDFRLHGVITDMTGNRVVYFDEVVED